MSAQDVRCASRAWACCKYAQYISPEQPPAGGIPETIRWRDAEADPPPNHRRILATLRDHPEQPAGECFTTGRPYSFAYFPGLNNSYRISLWAELPKGKA